MKNKNNKKINKTEIERNLTIIASICSPVAKAWIYTLATIGLLVMFIITPFLYMFQNADTYEIKGLTHTIFPIIQFILLTIQQKFNGQNWRTIIKARRDKKAKEVKKNENTSI